MAGEGFQYVPNHFDSRQDSSALNISSLISVLPVPNLSSDRNVVSQIGYGVMGTPEEQIAERTVFDANAAYRETLTATEADAYGRALYGDYHDPAGTTGSSCTGKALAQFPEPGQSDQEQSFETEFWDLVYSAWLSIAGDDRPGGLDDDDMTRQLDVEWESCLSSKGYVLERIGEVHGPALAMDLAVRTRPDGTIGPLHFNTPSVDIPVEEKSLLGTESERKVALADFDCRVETDYLARLTSIRVRRDEEFIAEHQAELDRLVAAAESW
ncbi:MAG: hypothetical protein LBV00_00695 [Propionibacteriaceae bacterium]|jgi:hypothetical protein|nr:hypothetical protein [Propionibacteriaceae bacterium]